MDRVPARAAVLGIAMGLVSPAPAITITEIQYHPEGGEDLEFVEIYNEDPLIVDLSGYSFTDGIDFTFPPGTYLEGFTYLVVCADADTIRDLYGIENVIGNYEGRLSNGGERLVLAAPHGGVVAEVDYNDRGRWPNAADGTGHSLILRDPYLDPSESESWDASPERGGSPGAPNIPAPYVREHEILPQDAVWRYWKGTSPPSSPATAWRAPGFDDGAWPEGRTGIGYGDGDDRTVLSDMRGNYVAVFARHVFEVEDPEALHAVYLGVTYDDAFIAYLNGVEIARSGMGQPGEEFPYDRTATASHEAAAMEFFSIARFRDILRPGENLLAAEIHNVSRTSSDLSFIPTIVDRETVRPQAKARPPVRINEVYRGDTGLRFVELYNGSDTRADVEGFRLRTDAAGLQQYVLPAGSRIQARGFLTLYEVELGFSLAGETLRLVLWTADGEQVVDAEVFDAIPDGMSLGRDPDGERRWAIARTPTPGAANRIDVERGVVIHEIMYHPFSGDAREEYIELYNRSDHPVDLAGCAFTKGIHYAFEDGPVLPSGAYLVVAGNADRIRSKYGLPPEAVVGDWTGVLSDGGEMVRLRDPLGNIMDEVHYVDGGRWPVWADGLGSSLELLDPDADNAVPSAWAASDEASKSEWVHVEYTARCADPAASELHLLLLERGGCLIDDLRLLDGTRNLIPNGDFEASLSGWIVEGTHVLSHRTTEDASRGRASLALVATGKGNNRCNRLEIATSPGLVAGRSYRIAYDARWLYGGNLVHTRGDGYDLAHTEALPVPDRPGTPGRANSVAVPNLGPTASRVRHAPPVPRAGARVEVRARITDPDGVDRAVLRYALGRRQGWRQVTLRDDGAHGDGAAGDGIYGGEIPGFPYRTKVLYYIEAQDERGVVRRYPVEAPERTHLYQVDTDRPTPLLLYRLVLDDENLAELQGRPLHSNRLLDATFTFGESEVYQNVGVRYRGSPWQRGGSPRMFRVHVNEDEPFHGAQEFNLSRYGRSQSERTAYYTLRLNGAPYSPERHVTFYLNGSSSGTFQHIQPVNDRYLRYFWPEDADGYLFKISGRHTFNDSGGMTKNVWASFTYKGGDPETYRWWFLPRSGELEDRFDLLIDLLLVMDPGRTSNYAFDRTAETIIDVEEWIRVQTVRILNDDWDTIGVANGQNAYIYFAPREGRWKLIPWDVDHTFANANASLMPTHDRGMTRLLARPKYRRMYYRFLKELISGPYTVPSLSLLLDPTYEVLRLVASGSSNPQGIKNFVAARIARVRSMLPSGIAFAIVTNGGRDFSTEDEETKIRGTAPVEVAEIHLNGTPIEPAWSSLTSWSVDVALRPGANRLTFNGLDGMGRTLYGDTVIVTSEVRWPPPAIHFVLPTEGPEEGGTTVVIDGSGFQEGIAVLFGDEPAGSVLFDSSVQIRAMAPPGTGEVAIVVRNPDGQGAASPMPFRYIPSSPSFRRGDANGDGARNIADAIAVLDYTFRGVPAGCIDALDANDSGRIDIADGIYVLSFLFADGPAPAPPFPGCGRDPTEDSLDCGAYPGCE